MFLPTWVRKSTDLQGKVRKAFPLLSILAVVGSSLAPAEPWPSSHVYKRLGERKLRLVMHYPPNWQRSDDRVGIVFFSGSHKVRPDKDGNLPPLAAEREKLGLPVINRGPGGTHHIPLCDGFAQRGFVCMRVEYRTRGKDGVLPGEDIKDAFSAMGWVRSNASTLGVDPNLIVAAGGSSGGYLAASMFAFEDQHQPVGGGSMATRPNAIILYSPLVDWLEVGDRSDEFLVVLNNDKRLGARISPARHWRRDCPPTLVMVGTEEPPFLTVKAFAEQWKAKGASVDLFIADGREHGFFGKPDWREKTIRLTEKFLRENGVWPRSAIPEMTDANSATPPGSGSSADTPGFVPSRDWDEDEDRRISRAEFKGPARMFLNMDTDGDGTLSDGELAKLDSKLDIDKTGYTAWIVPPKETYRGVEHQTYFSETMQTRVGYNIYLPSEYETSGKRYPVIYHLHGSGGNESSQIDLSSVFERAIEDGRTVPVIIVFVNGGRRSYYTDSADGQIMAETTLIKELIPHVDSTWRTIPEKACRVIQGFSMGGFGALKLGMKYPDLFCAVLSFGGGMASPESVHMLFLKHILGGDESLLRANNPADIAVRNNDRLEDLTLWLFSGTRDVALEDTQWAHRFLEFQQIAHRFEVSQDTGHALKRHYQLFGDDIFQMLSENFRDSKMFLEQMKADVAVTPAARQSGAGDLARLIDHLQSPDLQRRVQAVQGLLELGQGGQVAFPSLVRILMADQSVDSRIAARALYARRRVPQDVGPFIEGLKLDHVKARAAAAWQLSQLGPSERNDTTRELLEALKYRDKHERNFAILAIAMNAPTAADVAPALLAVLNDRGSVDTPQMNYKYPRASAALVLGMLGSVARQAVPALTKVTEEKGSWEYQQAAACFALGRIGTDARKALPTLHRALQDASSIVRAQAARAIEAIEYSARGAVKGLDSAAESDVASLIRVLHSTGSRINPEILDGLSILGEFAGSSREIGKKLPRPPVHESISLAIGYIDSLTQQPSPVRIAREFQEGNPSSEIKQYIMALGGIQQGIAPVLLEALTHGERDERVSAIRRLAELGPLAENSIPTLRAALGDPDWIVRREAFLALGRIEPSGAFPFR